MTTTDNATTFKDAINANGFTPTEIGEAIHTRASHVYRWADGSKKIPALYRSRLDSISTSPPVYRVKQGEQFRANW